MQPIFITDDGSATKFSIPDSNYTRVENRKKRNHPKNINYTREGRMEKDIRTESASSSDSYLSRYLASRNSTPGTSRWD